MFDIHAHVLPGVDDGPRSMAESLDLLQGIVADGVTHLVVTPHIYPGVFDNHWEGICAAFNELCVEVDRAQLPLKLCFAAEVRLCPEMLDWLQTGDLPVMAGVAESDHAVLVELPDGVVPIGAEQVLRQLVREGVQPIIAHPERNRAIMENPAKAESLIQAGAVLQVTAGSLLSEFGERAARTARLLLDAGLVHVVASDSHNMRSRAPRMGAARAWLVENFGEVMAQTLTYTNPFALAGRPMRQTVGPSGVTLRDLPVRFLPSRAFKRGAEVAPLKDWRASWGGTQQGATSEEGVRVGNGFSELPRTAAEARTGARNIDDAWRLPALMPLVPKTQAPQAPTPVAAPSEPDMASRGKVPEFFDSVQTRIAAETNWTDSMSFEETRPATAEVRPVDSWGQQASNVQKPPGLRADERIVLQVPPTDSRVSEPAVAVSKPRSWVQRAFGKKERVAVPAHTDWPSQPAETQPAAMSMPRRVVDAPRHDPSPSALQDLDANEGSQLLKPALGLSLRQFDPVDGKPVS